MKNVKGKKKKVWTPDAYIKSHLRKIWRWSPQRRQCLKAKQCVQCGERKKKLYADHISPVVDTSLGFQTWDIYIQRLFGGSLQPLCEFCHKAKSSGEAKERQAARKWRKEHLNAPMA